MSTTKLLDSVLESYEGWEGAIADAESQARTPEGKAERLRAVAGVLKRKLEAGEPWPGSSEPATRD